MTDIHSIEPTLLATKIQLPPIQSSRMRRPRIERLLDAAIPHPLTVVSAPAGFGKTTAIVQWLRNQPLAYGWFALDELDNDPARFWRYAATALAMPMDHYQQMLRPDTFDYLDRLINTLANKQTATVLVFDDVHILTQTHIHAGLAYLVEHAPSNLHIILSTRTDAPFPTAGLRAKEKIVEITSGDLRFTAPESATFLRDVHHLEISDTDVQELVRRTDGWCAALHLAVLSMHDQHAVHTIIQRFSGQHHYIVAYLTEEVLAHESERVRYFMESTALLHRFNAHVCMAVTGFTDASAMLEYLEKANLLIQPLDDTHTWFRYHPLMAEYLQTQLRNTDPARILIVQRCAVEWFAAHDDYDTAIMHALDAHLIDLAIPLIVRFAPAKIARGEMSILFSWLCALPAQQMKTHPQLVLLYATVLINNGQLDEAEKYVQFAEHLLTKHSNIVQHDLVPLDTTNGIHGTLGEVYGARSIIASFRGHVQLALSYTQQAILMLPESNSFVHSVMLASIAAAYWWSGDVVQARHAFHESWLYATKEHMLHSIIASLCGEGFAVFLQGHYVDAITLFNEAIRQATTPADIVLPAATMAYIGIGAIYREWDDLSAAQTMLENGLNISAEWGDIGLVLYGELQMARINQVFGKSQQSYTRVRIIEQAIVRMDANHYLPTIASAYAYFALTTGDAQSAIQWARSILPRQGESLNYLSEYEWLIALHVFVALQHISEAAICFEQIEEPARVAGRFNSLIEVLMLKALWWEQQGELATAFQCLDDVLCQAEPNGYLRMFITEGKPMHSLLVRLQQRQPRAATYIATILSHFPTLNSSSPADPMILNQRESEILKLIAEGLENKAIAERLIVAPSTIKWHLKHIFLKLHVHTRAQAVVRARENGII